MSAPPAPDGQSDLPRTADVLSRLADVLNGCRSREEILAATVEHLAELPGVTRAVLSLDGEAAAWPPDGPDAPLAEQPVLLEGEAIGWIRLAVPTTGVVPALLPAFGAVIAIAVARVGLFDRMGRIVDAQTSALMQSQERFRDFAEAASDWIWETGPDLRFFYVSDRFESVTGLPVAALIGRRLTELLGQGLADAEAVGAARAFRPFRAVLQTATALPGGRALSLRISGRPLFDPSGAFLGYRGAASDITAEVLAERKAAHAEAMLASAVETLSEGFALIDPEGRVLLTNQPFRALFDQSCVCLDPGTPLAEIAACLRADAEALEVAAGSALGVLAGPGSHDLHMADGRWLRFLVQERQEGGLAIVTVDITPLKRSQEELWALARRNQLLASAIAASRIANVITGGPDTGMAVMFANPAFFALTGFAPTEIAFRPFTFLQGPGTDRATLERMMAAVAAGWPAEESLLAYRRDGTTFTMELRLTPMPGEEGRIANVLVVMTDITERLRAQEALAVSEQRYRLVSEMTSDIIYLCAVDDRGGERIEWRAGPSAEIGTLLDTHRPGEPLWMDAVHEEDLPLLRERQRRLLAGQRHDAEFRIRTRLGKLRWLREQARPGFHEDGQTVLRTLGAVSDVTAIKALQREHEDYQSRFQQLQKLEAISSLTGGIAHDFNNILSIVIGHLDLLHELVEGDGELTESVDAALQASLRGADLTRQLLAMARRQPLQPRLTDVNELIQGMSRLLRRTLGAGVVTVLETDADVHRVRVDPGLLESALVNLAVNARDAMGGQGTLMIRSFNIGLDDSWRSLFPDVRAGDYAVIEVTDTGMGMSPEIRERLFEPFFTTKANGTGLGLSMVYGFVKQSGGQISVESLPGRGSSFRLFLPRAAAGDERPEPPEETGAEGGTEHILVVDDDDGVRAVAMRQLADSGYRVTGMAAPAQALAFLERNDDVALVFSDVVMPGGLSGFDLARLVAERRPGLPVLLTSGYPQEMSAERAAGLPELLYKPYRRDQLTRRVRQLIDRSAASEAQPQEAGGAAAPEAKEGAR